MPAGLFYQRLLELKDSRGDNTFRSLVNDSHTEYHVDNDSYHEIIDAFISERDKLMGRWRFETKRTGLKSTPVFIIEHNSETPVWDDCEPEIEGDFVYYFSLRKTRGVLQEFARDNRLIMTNWIPWPDKDFIDSFMFNTCPTEESPLFPRPMMAFIEKNCKTLYPYIQHLPTSNLTTRETIEFQIGCVHYMRNRLEEIDESNFVKINQLLEEQFSPDRKLTNSLLDSFGRDWCSSPYTIATISRYLKRTSPDIHKHAVLTEIDHLISQISRASAHKDHLSVAMICSVAIRDSFKYLESKRYYYKYKAIESCWTECQRETFQVDAMNKLNLLLKEYGKAKSTKYISLLTYGKKSSDGHTAKVKDIIQQGCGGSIFCKSVNGFVQGFGDIRISGNFDEIYGITATTNGVIDFTSGSLVIREGRPEDMVLVRIRRTFDNQLLKSISRGNLVDELAMSEGNKDIDPLLLQMEAMLPPPRHLPTKPEDIPMFQSLSKTFWDPAGRKESNKAAINFLKIMGARFTLANPKAIISIAGPQGNDGKSTLCAILHALGDFSAPIEKSDLLSSGKNGGPNPALAEAVSKHFGYTSEVSNGMKINAEVVKMLVGDDRRQLRKLFENGSVKRMRLVLLLIGNSHAKYSFVDQSLMARLYYFNADGQFKENAPKTEKKQWEIGKFPEIKEIAGNEQMVKELAQQLFVLFIYYADLYLKEGITMTKKSTDIKAMEIAKGNKPLTFLLHEVTPKNGETIMIDTLYDAYLSWHESHERSKYPVSRDKFVNQIQSYTKKVKEDGKNSLLLDHMFNGDITAPNFSDSEDSDEDY